MKAPVKIANISCMAICFPKMGNSKSGKTGQQFHNNVSEFTQGLKPWQWKYS